MNRLIKKLPNYYKNSTVIKELTNSEDEALIDFAINIEKTLNEFFLETSVSTLERWEKELEIPINKNYSIEERRERILSKVRGTGTVTIQMIKNVVKSFTNGTVEIIEDNPSYIFTIKFIDLKGIPPNMNIVKNAIDEIKPAHLDYKFEYKYTIWCEVKTKTWNDFNNHTWNELMIREVI